MTNLKVQKKFFSYPCLGFFHQNQPGGVNRSFVTTDEFPVRVTKITSRIGVS